MRWLYTTFYSEDKYTKSMQASGPQGRNIEIQYFLSEPKIAIHMPVHLLQMAVREACVARKRGKT